MTIYLNKKCGLLLMFCCRIAKHRQGSTISESHEARLCSQKYNNKIERSKNLPKCLSLIVTFYILYSRFKINVVFMS